MASACEPLHLVLDNTLGVALIGGVAAAVLYGITNMQTLIYFQAASRDPVYMKSLVAFLWSMDGLHIAFIFHALYFYMVTNFSNPLAIFQPTWSLVSQVVVTNISDSIVRCIFARRIWTLSHGNYVLTVTAFTLAAVVLVGGMAFSIKVYSFKSYAEFHSISWLLYASLGSVVAADVWTASSLCYLLNRNRTGFQRTDSIVNILMMYCINTGLLTSLCAIGCFMAYTLWPNNFIFMGLYFVLSKLYLNSLLATLNARDSIREKAGLPSIQMSNIGSSTGFSQFEKTQDPFRPLAVTVETVTDMKVDPSGGRGVFQYDTDKYIGLAA